MLLEEASLLPHAPDQSDSNLVKDVLVCILQASCSTSAIA